AAPSEPARETSSFRLYKFQQPIGSEQVIRSRSADGRTEIRSSFAFTDRSTTVPLSATLTLAKDGSVLRFQEWGSTSRPTRVDDRVSVEGGSVTIERNGQMTTARAPAVFFVASAYAPVAVTEELWRYWSAHGRPGELTVFPAGRVTIEDRGKEEGSDDDGKKVTLERFALSGLAWGRETLWLHSGGHLAALKGGGAEVD